MASLSTVSMPYAPRKLERCSIRLSKLQIDIIDRASIIHQMADVLSWLLTTTRYSTSLNYVLRNSTNSKAKYNINPQSHTSYKTDPTSFEWAKMFGFNVSNYKHFARLPQTLWIVSYSDLGRPVTENVFLAQTNDSSVQQRAS